MRVTGGRTWPAITLCLFAFLLGEFLYPPFPETDEAFFKAAGRNLAFHGRFAAPELENFLHADPAIERIYSAYPPLYSWLFGQLVVWSGFGWRTCNGYDAVISALLALCIFGLSLRVAETLGANGLEVLGVSLATALITVVFGQRARPDELAMLFAYANFWLLLSRPLSGTTAFVAGGLAGLTLGTSTGVFLLFLLPTVAFWWRTHRITFVRPACFSLLGGLIVTTIWITPLWSMDTHFYRQFLQHASFHLKQSLIEGSAESLSLFWAVARPRLFLLAATFPLFLLATAVALWRKRAWIDVIAFYLAPLAGFALLLSLRSEFTYCWFLQPWFALVAFLFLRDIARFHRAAGMIAALVLIGFLALATLWPLKSWLVYVTLPPTQRLGFAETQVRALVPPGSVVLTNGAWWSLAQDREVLSPDFSDIVDLRRIEYFVSDGNGSRVPGKWHEPQNPRYASEVRDNFEIVSNGLAREPLRIFGYRVTNSAYGFGAVVMRRKHPNPQTDAGELKPNLGR